MANEERIAMFLDYENLALGARDHLGGEFELKPITDALAERGRVVVRRAYADWSYFDEDRRMLTRAQVELIEMTQRMGASRKNAADIKMAVDAIEMAFSKDYISTFVICTGDSDFTPLVLKLRELDKKVIGFGVRDSTSKMLPPACDEFLYYDNLEGVEPLPAKEVAAARARSGGSSSAGDKKSGRGKKNDKTSGSDPVAAPAAEPAAGEDVEEVTAEETTQPDLAVLVAQTLSGLQSSQGGEITASVLKRTLVRKDPTFSEADYGFRAFGELLRHLADRNVIELSQGPAKGDPEILLPETGDKDEAFALLRSVVEELSKGQESVPLSGLKDQLRRKEPGFSEKKLGYRSFLQFSRAAATEGVIALDWSDVDKDYLLESVAS
ncbi:NYN domain-containing protein [Ornithinimicrobium ciconiae]|uniref:NYN domain-containing protein n=1 Tax=Ornithinimicrobium ciconiae TaxID=2594265 RepID=A0A516GCP4_9MICO|nr:PIN domain-containing protein [Ornithinimicrobium ciconiae]QDO89283.1 NYN domain-containing protein [Ornithinimicrobium ciconiae]